RRHRCWSRELNSTERVQIFAKCEASLYERPLSHRMVSASKQSSRLPMQVESFHTRRYERFARRDRRPLSQLRSAMSQAASWGQAALQFEPSLSRREFRFLQPTL